jgi:NADPH2:quinone reductase
MHAIRLHQFGPADHLRYEEVDDPKPGPGQVRIAVAAAGVHLVDAHLRAGVQVGTFPPPDLPTVPGREVAGVVDATGVGVDDSWNGRRVVAHLGLASGGYAELAVCAIEALHALPDHLAFDAAVAMIGTGRTTMGILEVAQLRESDVVVVMAAAGGIGNLLVQEAQHVGATVVGTAGGPEKVAQVDALGADVAVDYDEPNWADAVTAALGDRRVTVVCDGVGGERGRAAMKLLAPGGRLVLYGGSSGEWVPLSVDDLYAGGFSATVTIGPRLFDRPGGLRGLEEQALSAAASGRLVPLVGTRFPLAEAAAAQTAIVNRATTGKVVLIP